VCQQLKITSNQEDLLISNVLKDDQSNIIRNQNIKEQIESTFDKLYFKISSYLPEFMLSGLLKMEKYNVNFIPESNIEKRCDLYIDNVKIEIKTIHDEARHTLELEEDLEKEVWRTMDRKKIKKHIKDALEKRADLIILFLSYTSVGYQMLQHAHKINYKVEYSFSKAIKHAIQINMKKKDDEIPLVIFTTGIFPNDKYSYAIFSYLIALPVTTGIKNIVLDETRLKNYLNL